MILDLSVVAGGLWVLVGEQLRCLSVGPEAAHHVGKGELQMARTGREGERERERSRGRGREAVTEGEAEHKLFSCSTTHHQNKRKLDSKQNKQSKCIYPDFIIRSQKNLLSLSLSLFLVFFFSLCFFCFGCVCVCLFFFFAVDRFVNLLVLVFFFALLWWSLWVCCLLWMRDHLSIRGDV